MDFNSFVHGVTTIISAKSGEEEWNGSGFFYHELAEPGGQEKKWIEVKNTWLVTNRHVLLSAHDGIETVPDSLWFRFRRTVNNILSWDWITLTKHEIITRTRIHKDPIVDQIPRKSGGRIIAAGFERDE